jgi:hypothetical protein
MICIGQSGCEEEVEEGIATMSQLSGVIGRIVVLVVIDRCARRD